MEVIETENIQIAEVTPKASLPEKASHVLSAIFNPFLVPSYAFVLLFAFTYLNIMPIQYVLFVLSIVASFTIISPWLFICLYKVPYATNFRCKDTTIFLHMNTHAGAIKKKSTNSKLSKC